MSVFSTLVLILGGTATIVAAVVAVYRIARRVEQAIGTDSKGRTISERLDRVEHQLWENGGGSLKDQVNDLQKCQTEMNAKMGVIEGLLLAMVEPKPKKARKANLNIVE